MKSRAMLRRLDPIAPPEKERWPRRDLAVLSPWQYDRLMDLSKQFASLSARERREAAALLVKCPITADNERSLVPVRVSRTLAHYWEWSRGVSGWRSYSFHRLRMVERERFLELCAHYGWRDGLPVKGRMLPLEEWDPDDQEELNVLLELADSGNEERRSI